MEKSSMALQLMVEIMGMGALFVLFVKNRYNRVVTTVIGLAACVIIVAFMVTVLKSAVSVDILNSTSSFTLS